jgi:hypothetical protein
MTKTLRVAYSAVSASAIVLTSLASAATPVNDICKGAKVRVQPDDVAIREKPQDRFLIFYGTGRQVGTLRKNEVVEVRDVKVIRTALGEQKWIQIGTSAGRGWVFVGAPGARASCCVEAVTPPPRSDCN